MLRPLQAPCLRCVLVALTRAKQTCSVAVAVSAPLPDRVSSLRPRSGWRSLGTAAPSSTTPRPRRAAVAATSSADSQPPSPFPSTSAALAPPLADPLEVQGLAAQQAAGEAAGAEAKVRKGGKVRLDALAQEQYPQYSRSLLQSWILQGKVLVGGRPVTKAGTAVAASAAVEITAEDPKFVCRGGYKLEAALERFGIPVEGAVALDSGLSTGGFTDCLLQRGAAKVYGVDVGYGQVHERIRTDPRVVVMERTNLRHLGPLPERIDFASLDLSFISSLKCLPAVAAQMRPGARLVLLIKPQFEARRGQVGGGGVVRDPAVHKEVIERVVAGAVAMGFDCQGTMESPIRGAKEGNKEFLGVFRLAREFVAPVRAASSQSGEDDSSSSGEEEEEGARQEPPAAT